jgi:hypothetical protein
MEDAILAFRDRRDPKMRSNLRRVRLPWVLSGILALTACAQTTINLDRDNRLDGSDDGELETISPYGFADRFGEPDVWRNEGETHGGLTMTQIWKCAEGRYREITWRMVQRSQGGMAWTIVNDINREGECEPPAKSEARSAADPPSAPPPGQPGDPPSVDPGG